jgi:hypothetical protein
MFLLGHSLGGLIVSAAQLSDRRSIWFDHVVGVLGLGWKAGRQGSRGSMMSSLMPALTMKSDLSAALLSHDPL